MAKTPAGKAEREPEMKKAPLPPEIDSIYTEDIPRRPIPNVLALFTQALRLVAKNWRVLLGLAAIYMLLNLLLVQGLNATSNLGQAKSSLDSISGGGLSKLTNGVSLYTFLLGDSGSSIAPTAGAYQFVLSVVLTLAVIWALRQIYIGRDIRIRDAFYYGMYPLVTFFLVLLMVVVHLLPFALGSVLYGIISANGIAVGPLEATSFLLLFLLLASLSLYLVCSSVFALYIVTLPEVTPMAALRSARELVVHRRWTVIRKVLFMPLALLILGGVLLVPVVLLATGLAPWIFTAVAAVALVYGHAYMYTLYRALL